MLQAYPIYIPHAHLIHTGSDYIVGLYKKKQALDNHDGRLISKFKDSTKPSLHATVAIANEAIQTNSVEEYLLCSSFQS